LIQYNHDIIDMFKCNHEIPLQKNWILETYWIE
jgi:hypothetical protein